MTAGAMHRYLADCVYCPSALLPDQHLRWDGLNANSARATLTVGPISVSLDFRFTPAGLVEKAHTAGRWGRFSEGLDQRPWEARFSEFHPRQGLLVPRGSEAGWYCDDEWTAVWRGTLVEADYEFEKLSAKLALGAEFSYFQSLNRIRFDAVS
jgi:hypothetical protein